MMAADVTVIASVDAEQAVLGALLLSNDAIDQISDLRAEHFYRADHQEIFRQMVSMILDGVGADVLTLRERLDRKCPDLVTLPYLNSLYQNTPSAANIVRYAQIVRDRAQRRGLAELTAEIQDAARLPVDDTDVLIGRCQAGLELLTEQREGAEPVRVSEDLAAYLEDLSSRAEGKGQQAISTGHRDLDERLGGGLYGGGLYVVAARPKMGKTAFAMGIARNVSGAGHPAAFLSQEMPRRQLHDRNVAAVGKIPLNHVTDPKKLRGDDWPKLTYAIQTLETLPLWVDDQGGLRLMDVRAKARLLKRRHNLKVLFIDYLQLMEGDGNTRNDQIEQITRGLKSLAKELDIAIVLLSQLNRGLEQRPNKRPMPSDLRDSGAIEQDADAVIFLYRDEVYNPDSQDRGICEVIIGLLRQGEPGTVALRFVGEYTRFDDLALGTEFGRAPAPARKPVYSGLKD